MSEIRDSELVLAPNGSLYHINMKGENLADDVILVGDPGRIEMFKGFFDSIEFESQNREMHALTGQYRGHRFTALSTGMGCDNIDIVMTELDAAANIDLETRTVKFSLRKLNIVRIGTSGSLQGDVPVGSFVASAYSVGMDGLMNYYEHSDSDFETDMQKALCKHMMFPPSMAEPYCVKCGAGLYDTVAKNMVKAITATAPGFYAPQGRRIRLRPTLSSLNERLASFSWKGVPIVNLEMETSAIYGFSRLMGHEALTVCLIIANRVSGTFLNDYHDAMGKLILHVLDSLADR